VSCCHSALSDKPETSEFACTGSDQLLAVLAVWSANYDPQKLKLQQFELSKEPLDEGEAGTLKLTVLDRVVNALVRWGLDLKDLHITSQPCLLSEHITRVFEERFTIYEVKLLTRSSSWTWR
jgi:hypothetical protein